MDMHVLYVGNKSGGNSSSVVGTIVLYVFLSLCLLMIIIIGTICHCLMKKRKYISNIIDTIKDELVVTQADGTIISVSNEPNHDNGGDVELQHT